MNDDIVIKIDNLSKVYKLYRSQADHVKEFFHGYKKAYHQKFHALNDINLQIKKGDTVGLIGRNGSGKSTLLKLIAGVSTPTTGCVNTSGRISALLELGSGFNPQLTGLENVFFNCAILGYKKAEINTRLDDILAFADIGDFIYQPVKMYSSGMFVRLAFSVAINVDPEILIVDEALAVGDMNFQSKCYSRLNSLKQQGKTILFVSHALESITKFCNKAILLDHGSMIFAGSTKETIDVYNKVLSNCYYPAAKTDSTSACATADNAAYRYQPEKQLKENFVLNTNHVDYGDKKAEIVDFGIFDGQGNPTQALTHGEPFSIKMVLNFKECIEHPIFAYSIKDIQGLDLTGTNTLFKEIDTERFGKSGKTVLVEFVQQRLTMKSGKYSLSLGCTEQSGDGLIVHQRLYDILIFEIISDKAVPGLFDMGGDIKMELLN